MKKGLTFLLSLLIIVVVWFVIPVLLIVLNIYYCLPVIINVYIKAVGFVIFLFGASSMVYTVYYHLVTGRITPVAIEKPKEFIDKGLYKYCRNPMYVAILTTFFGGFLVLGYLLLLGYVILVAIVLHLFVVYKEEPELRKLFGKEYEHYLKRVPRWLPKLK